MFRDYPLFCHAGQPVVPALKACSKCRAASETRSFMDASLCDSGADVRGQVRSLKLPSHPPVPCIHGLIAQVTIFNWRSADYVHHKRRRNSGNAPEKRPDFGGINGSYDRPALTSLFRRDCSAKLVDFRFHAGRRPPRKLNKSGLTYRIKAPKVVALLRPSEVGRVDVSGDAIK
jgi:hypothetical protein